MTGTKWKKMKLLCVFLLTFPCLTGCWDRIEIEERAVLLGIGVDVAGPKDANKEKKVTHLNAKESKPSTGRVRVTAQIAVPGRIPLGPAQGGGGTQKPVWVLSTVGDTIDDAMMTLQQQVAYRLFFGHLRVIVISEEIAKRGVQNLNDYLRRNPEVRRTVWVLVSKGEAEKSMKAVPELERVPTLYLNATMDQAVKLGKLPPDFVGIFWSATSSKGQDPFLPYIEVRQNNIFISGLAYFRGDRMVGTTEPLEIGYVMELRNIKTGGYSGLHDIPGQSTAVMIEATSRTSKIQVEIKNGKPHVTTKTHLEVNVVEKSNEAAAISKPGIIQQIQQQIQKDAEQGQQKLIKKTQEKGSDIFGFGEYVRAKFPAYWKQNIQSKDKWEEMYKEISIENHVTANIRRIGMKAR